MGNNEAETVERCEKSAKLGTKQFVFLEMFSGMAGLSSVMSEIASQHNVQVMEPLDLYGDWNILEQMGMERALALADAADHVHIAFPCHSFSRARGPRSYNSISFLTYFSFGCTTTP